MSFLAISNYLIPCQCIEFANDLLNLSKDIFLIESGKLQWTAFEKFIDQQLQLRNNSHTSEMPSNLCISSDLNCRILKVLKSRGMAPSNLILDIMSNIYLKNTRHFRIYLDWNFNEPSTFESNYETLRIIAAFHGPTNFMKLLINFGHLSSLQEDSPDLRNVTNDLMFNFISSVSSRGDKYSIFERIMDILKSFFRSNGDGKFYRRIFFAGIALHAVRYNLKKDYNEAEKLITCLRLYFSATRDLLLTIFDVRSVIYVCFILLNQSDLFDIYSEEFDNLMPECPATLQPRKLLHLARCQVRQNLKASNLPLPAAIEKLQLPRTVKCFVLCDEFDFPSNNRNASVKNAITKSELERLFFWRL